MASGSADDALSPPATSFVICEKTWKLSDPIHSTGIGAIKEKWSKVLDAFATARAGGVFMGTWVWPEISREMDQSV